MTSKYKIVKYKDLEKHCKGFDISYMKALDDGEFFGEDKRITPRIKKYNIKVNKEKASKLKNNLKKLNTSFKGDTAEIDYGKLTIVLKKSGKKSGASDGASTTMQELASLRIIREGIANRKRFKDVKDIATDDVYKDLLEIYPNINDVWMKGLLAQHIRMNKEFGTKKFDVYNRDGGFMDYISKHIKNRYGIAKKDSWNPADIWLIKDEAKVVREIEATKSLQQLNDVMRKQYREARCVGISLKAISGANARFEEVNLKDNFKNSDEYTLNNIRMNMKVDAKGRLSTTDTVITIKSGSFGAKFQLRQNSKGFNNLKFEPTQIGAGAARLGKVPLDMLKSLLKDYGIKDFDNKWQNYPLSGLEYEEEGSYYVKMFKKVKSIADTGVSLAKFNDNMIKSFDTDDTENGYTTSKLMQLHFVYGLCSLSDKQRNDLLTEMLYLAMKKGPKFGPFGKLY
jgi:hypothetical protein